MEKLDFIKELKSISEKNGFNLNETQLEQFYNYMILLNEWNEKINLTAIVEPKEIIIKHFTDSLMVVKEINKNSKIIDVGTGAGFPGLPIKIYYPEINVELLDSLNKRINFLNEVINKLKLNNIEAIHGRAEEFALKNEHREKYDYAISRAVAPLNILLEYLSPYVKVGGKIIAMKGNNIEEEINNSKNALNILGCKVHEIKEINLPENMGKRNIIIINKIKNTPKSYPRNAGIPKKKPL